jgi:hypothetical protein
MPTYRMPPPIIFLNFLALVINSLLPTSIDPKGQHSPLERQKEIESASFPISLDSS